MQDNGNGQPVFEHGPRIFLGMPGYGDVSAAAALGFHRAVRDLSAVWLNYRQGSLLASNFNALWCTALNMQRNGGKRVDYFAMQHADIEPPEFWLDDLIAELESRDLDVLGVAVPIKDTNGVTSIALHREGDNWQPLCRLTMTEIHRLPATFTSEDVGHPLLLNTGLWVCRFDKRWNDQVHFTINDRIVQYPDGRYGAQVEPEDWFVSRLFHELGLKVGVTRKIKVGHRGQDVWRNDEPWGNEYDRDYIGRSVVPQSEYEFPHDVDGWLSVAEGEALRELARSKRVLEIGSYCGRSTICLAQSAESVVAIDPFDGTATPNPRDTKGEFLDNLHRYKVANKVHPFNRWTTYRECSKEMPEIVPGQFDLVFIDGDHSLDAVQMDIEIALSLLADGGLIAFHDYRTYEGQYDGRWDPGVSQAVDEFVAHGAEIIAQHDSLAVVRPPAYSVLSTHSGKLLTAEVTV